MSSTLYYSPKTIYICTVDGRERQYDSCTDIYQDNNILKFTSKNGDDFLINLDNVMMVGFIEPEDQES